MKLLLERGRRRLKDEKGKNEFHEKNLTGNAGLYPVDRFEEPNTFRSWFIKAPERLIKYARQSFVKLQKDFLEKNGTRYMIVDVALGIK